MKRLLALFLFAIALAFFPLVFADGMVHYKPVDSDLWLLQPEKQQVAAINYQDGFENMLVSVDIDSEVQGKKAVWIFPVPAKPNTIAIDIFKGFPGFSGSDIEQQFKGAVTGAAVAMNIYSLIPPFGLLAFLAMGTMSFSGREPGTGKGSGVTIHETIQKMGLTSELITTKSQEALSQYLEKKGLKLPENSSAVLREYVGKDYSFVVSYINDFEKFKQESLHAGYGGYYNNQGRLPIGVFIRFPTEKMYFPLKPTSVYGSTEIPILLFVVGHVSPELYPQIKPLSKTAYYSRNYAFYPNKSNAAFFNSKEKIDHFAYTKIKIKAPSKYLSEDLWIDNRAPLGVAAKGFFAANILFLGIIWFAVLCMASSLLAGIIAFRKPPLPRKKLLLHGLWNVLTLIAFAIATAYLKTKKLDPKIEEELKKKGINVTVRDRRKILYGFLFYVFFIGLTIASTLFLLAL